MVSILIIAEVAFYAEGLAKWLERSSDIEVVGTASVVDVLASCHEHDPDVVLIDPAVRGSLEAVQVLDRHKLQVQILALVPESELDAIAWATAGVVAYVSRYASLQESCEAIHHAARGEPHCPGRAAHGLQAKVESRTTALPANSTPHPCLTPREFDVVRLIDLGMSNNEIAQELHISLSTVKNHVHNLLTKLGATRRGEAAALARRMWRGAPSTWTHES